MEREALFFIIGGARKRNKEIEVAMSVSEQRPTVWFLGREKLMSAIVKTQIENLDQPCFLEGLSDMFRLL